MNILGLIKDLVLSTQVRNACEAKGYKYASGRNEERFNQALEELKPDRVIIDLNADGIDPFVAIEKAKSLIPAENILCFFSHVNGELADKALAMGLLKEQIFIRSKFFSNLGAVIQ